MARICKPYANDSATPACEQPSATPHCLPNTDDTALDALTTIRNQTKLHRPAYRGGLHRHVTVTDMEKPLRQ